MLRFAELVNWMLLLWPVVPYLLEKQYTNTMPGSDGVQAGAVTLPKVNRPPQIFLSVLIHHTSKQYDTYVSSLSLSPA